LVGLVDVLIIIAFDKSYFLSPMRDVLNLSVISLLLVFGVLRAYSDNILSKDIVRCLLLCVCFLIVFVIPYIIYSFSNLPLENVRQNQRQYLSVQECRRISYGYYSEKRNPYILFADRIADRTKVPEGFKMLDEMRRNYIIETPIDMGGIKIPGSYLLANTDEEKLEIISSSIHQKTKKYGEIAYLHMKGQLLMWKGHVAECLKVSDFFVWLRRQLKMEHYIGCGRNSYFGRCL